MSILVFTPDADAAASLCSALGRSGQKAAWVANGEQAEASLRAEKPLVLVADIDSETHRKVVADLRADAPWARVLLIGRAAEAADFDVQVIAKPFDASELASLLAREGQLAALERSRHDLKDRIAGLTLLVDECFEAIVGLSAEGVVRSWNPGAASLYGYTAEEIIGQNVAVLDVAPSTTQTRLSRAESRAEQVRRRHKSGRELFVMASVSAVARARGRHRAVGGLTRLHRAA
jgi:PAS domain S-box-containing protein